MASLLLDGCQYNTTCPAVGRADGCITHVLDRKHLNAVFHHRACVDPPLRLVQEKQRDVRQQKARWIRCLPPQQGTTTATRYCTAGGLCCAVEPVFSRYPGISLPYRYVRQREHQQPPDKDAYGSSMQRSPAIPVLRHRLPTGSLLCTTPVRSLFLHDVHEPLFSHHEAIRGGKCAEREAGDPEKHN